MKERLKANRLLNYILYNMYFEMLFLYLLLFFYLIMPIIALVIVVVGSMIRNTVRTDFIDALANIVKRLLHMADRNFLLISTIIIVFILFKICLKRIKKGVFSDSFLLIKIFKNQNNDFKIYLGLYIPIILIALYFLLFISEGYFNYYTYLRTLIVAIVGLTLLNYAEQINIIMMNIKDIGTTNIRVKNDSLIMGFTKKSIDMLDNIDDNIKESIENQLKSERLKTELITNISHDLKTPLTSIINYTDLLKKYEFEDADVKTYVNVLDRNSQRLKVLITDLVEASKTETGNVNLKLEKLELNELIYQIYGEFDNVFREKEISFIFDPQEEYFVYADGSHLGRVIENIMGNASKYSQEKTRVYAMTIEEEGYISLVIKNISRDELNISPDELMERFIRGERSRHTEGSGLGLYIARNLIELMNGKLSISIDGDLFGIKLLIPKAE
jgi:signal transduction histidine kinase